MYYKVSHMFHVCVCDHKTILSIRILNGVFLCSIAVGVSFEI